MTAPATRRRSQTRAQILACMAEGMHRYGYQGLRTDKVIEALGITKGAFYHYFTDKANVAQAVIAEMHAQAYAQTWSQLRHAPGPVLANLVAALEAIKASATEASVALGCPVTNLIQEMAPLDDAIRNQLEQILTGELAAIGNAIEHGQAQGQLNPALNAQDEALYILNALQGAYSTAKLFRSKAMFYKGIEAIIRYVQALGLGSPAAA